MKEITVAFVDDHPVLLEGIGKIFSMDRAFRVVASGNSASDAIHISKEFRPDVLVMDLNMQGNAFEAIGSITRDVPDTKVVAFTASSDTDAAVKALGSGASGYVFKGSTTEELRRAILAVLQGGTFISQEVALGVVDALRSGKKRPDPDHKGLKLSIREHQVIKFLLIGKTNREIAAELGIGEKTVKHYIGIMLQKLQARNRTELVIAAQKLPQVTTGPWSGDYMN